MLIVYSLTIFIGSFLLFLVQPIIGKMVLPLLGGTPAVWNTCMVFFQAVLLGGYLYAFAVSRYLRRWQHFALHILLLVVALSFLPLTLSQANQPNVEAPVRWLLLQLLTVAGVPFLAISTNAPLVQQWFACTKHRCAADPYFLYAASNFGSFLALLSYPFVIEPYFTLSEQTAMWRGIYFCYITLAICCMTFAQWIGGDGKDKAEKLSSASENTGRMTWNERRLWIFASFIPSTMLLGVTTFITTNIAPVPLLWVVPLALYLLSFVIVFSRWQWLSERLLSRAMPLICLPFIPLFFFEVPVVWLQLLLHFLMFFFLAIFCHQRLAATRPSVQHLTEFYFWISVGGVLGGSFSALIAPNLFTSPLEYPLCLIFACLLLPWPEGGLSISRGLVGDIVVPALLGLLIFAVFGISSTDLNSSHLLVVPVFGIPAMLCFSCRRRPLRFSFGLLVIFLGFFYGTGFSSSRTLFATRNFFGLKQVALINDGQFHAFFHGGTVHGLQSVDPQKASEPLAYFYRTGPVGDIFTALRQQNQPLHVAILGLGAGTVSAYVRPGDLFTFYEIDLAVQQIAETPAYFSYLQRCAKQCKTVLGDGRLTLANAPDNSFQLIFLDVFSSDSVPAHLLTREALAMYARKLTPDGLLLFQASNRFLRLPPLLGALSAVGGFKAYERGDYVISAEESKLGKWASHYVVMSRNDELLRVLSERNWHLTQAAGRVWTDDYSNLLQVLRWK